MLSMTQTINVAGITEIFNRLRMNLKWVQACVCLLIFLAGIKPLKAQQDIPTDISAEQLIQFQIRGFSHTEVIMNAARGWYVSNNKTRSQVDVGPFPNISCEMEGWETKTRFKDVIFFQKIDLAVLKEGKKFLVYQTNSNRKYQLVLKALQLKSSRITGEQNFLTEDNHYRLNNNSDWEYSADNTGYDENDHRYKVIIYPTDSYRFYEADAEWDKVLDSDYDEEILNNYVNKFPLATNRQLALQKLQEVMNSRLIDDGSVGEIEAFTRRFPNSGYNAALNIRKDELKLIAVLNSNDEQLIYTRWLSENNADRKQKLFNAYHRSRYGKFQDTLAQFTKRTDKIAFLKGHVKAFENTDHQIEIIRQIHQLEFEELPQKDGEGCDKLELYVLLYPKSRYASVVSQRAVNCVEFVRNRRLLDSSRQVYDQLLKTTNYLGIINTGEFMLRLSKNGNLALQKQVSQYKDLYAFLFERRYKVYNLKDVSPNQYLILEKALTSMTKSQYASLRNVSFQVTVKYNIDTFGHGKTNILGTFPKSFKTDVVDLVKKEVPGKLLYREMPVMLSAGYNINYTSNSQTYTFTKTNSGRFTATGNTGSSVLMTRALAHMKANSADYKTGRYRVVVDDITCNNVNHTIMGIKNYKSNTGVIAVIPALVVPGLGTRLVRGETGNGWITTLTYSLAGLGFYYLNESNKTHTKYLAATNQSDRDALLTQYNKDRDNAAYSLGAAGAIYSINVTYVLFKGLGNNVRTLKYNRKYKKIKKQIQ